MRSSYNCIHFCYNECVDCPFDREPILKKDRSTLRFRHHSILKERKKAKQSANILCSKASKLPSNANHSQILKATQRAKHATKRSEKF